MHTTETVSINLQSCQRQTLSGEGRLDQSYGRCYCRRMMEQRTCEYFSSTRVTTLSAGIPVPAIRDLGSLMAGTGLYPLNAPHLTNMVDRWVLKLVVYISKGTVLEEASTQCEMLNYYYCIIYSLWHLANQKLPKSRLWHLASGAGFLYSTTSLPKQQV